MKKYGIVIDSTSYLSDKIVEEYDIIKVSLNIIDKEDTFKELEVTNDFVYDKLDQGHKLTTSQPAPGEFLNAYEEQLKKGYEKVFVITISEPLSGTFQSANLAKSMMDDPSKIIILDSNMASFGNEMVIIQLAEMIKENKTEKEIIKRITELFKTSNLVFTIENMISIYRSGRISKTKAAIGTVLRLKPLIQMIDGKLSILKSVRTHKAVVETLLHRMEETTKGFKTIHVRVQSKDSMEQALILEKAVKDRFKNAIISINDHLGPVFSLHLGKKGYGASWCAE
jgi:DegV family protein with EDD domain